MDGNNLEKKYGLTTATALVVGIVIGSGVFFKAEKILSLSGGSITTGILAWVLGGIIMLCCGYVFVQLAARYEKSGGFVDYAEAACGKNYGYAAGFFMAAVYYPSLTAILSWLAAKYTSLLCGFDNPSFGGETMAISVFYLILSFAVNILAPKIAGKFQIAATVAKLLPLVFIGIAGIIVGLLNGTAVSNFTYHAAEQQNGSLLRCVVATSFAYDGWIVAASINSEIKDSKKTLPKALLLGMSTIILIYILYFLGMSTAVGVEDMLYMGDDGVKHVFSSIFGRLGGSLLFVFVIISCLGTLNGLTMGCTRGFYSLAVRGEGLRPKVISSVDSGSNMPLNSGVLGLLCSALWLLVWSGNFAGWWGGVFLDISELTIVILYTSYIPIFIWIMLKWKGEGAFKRFIMPSLAIASSCFMAFSAILAHKVTFIYYLVIIAVIMTFGLLLNRSGSSNGRVCKENKK